MAASGQLLLRAKWVAPMDGPPIEGGYVAIEGGKIVAVSATPPDGQRVEDLGDALLLPGLVNAHAHLEFSSLTAPLGVRGMSLPAWIRLVIAERRRNVNQRDGAVAAGLVESLAAGVAAIGDICTTPAACYQEAAASPQVLAFHEAIGFSAGRVDSALVDAERRFNALPTGLSPHAPYTVHPRLLERLIELARRMQVPVAMHLAESPAELELLAAGSGPFRELLEERSMWDPSAIAPASRPMDYLRRLAAAPRAIVIHGNYLAADEIEFIAARRSAMSVVYCPRTHDWFGHAPYPLAAMRAAGVRVALGTDSRASNPDLSLLSDLRFAAARFSGIDPAWWVAAATIEGAAALGVDHLTGSLTPGKRADMIALPCSTGEKDPLAAVVGGSGPASPIWMADSERASCDGG